MKSAFWKVLKNIDVNKNMRSSIEQQLKNDAHNPTFAICQSTAYEIAIFDWVCTDFIGVGISTSTPINKIVNVCVDVLLQSACYIGIVKTLWSGYVLLFVVFLGWKKLAVRLIESFLCGIRSIFSMCFANSLRFFWMSFLISTPMNLSILVIDYDRIIYIPTSKGNTYIFRFDIRHTRRRYILALFTSSSVIIEISLAYHYIHLNQTRIRNWRIISMVDIKSAWHSRAGKKHVC